MHGSCFANAKLEKPSLVSSLFRVFATGSRTVLKFSHRTTNDTQCKVEVVYITAAERADDRVGQSRWVLRAKYRCHGVEKSITSA